MKLSGHMLLCLMSRIPQAGLHLLRHSFETVKKQELDPFQDPVRHEEQKSTTWRRKIHNYIIAAKQQK